MPRIVMDRRWTPPRPVLTIAGAALVLLAPLVAAVVVGATATRAQAAVYRWWIHTGEGTGTDMIVLPVDRDAWGAYIAASEARLDAWLARPGAAPLLDGTYVTVTFARPVSVTAFAAALDPLAGTVAQYTAVGEDAEGHLVEETGFGEPAADAFGAPRHDPGGGYRFTLDGVIEAELWVGTGRTVRPADLETVRLHPAVHFVDTTAIQVARIDLPASGAGLATPIDTVVMDSPWYELSW